MKLGPAHFSALGLGVTAVAAIAGIYFYRSQAAKPAASPDTSGAGAFPYFQTAALPTGSGGGGSGTAVTPTTAAAATGNSDLSSILATLAASQASQARQSDKTSIMQTFGGMLTGLVSQLSAQQGSDPLTHSPSVVKAYFEPTATGGFDYGILTVPSAWSTTNLLTFAEYARNSFIPLPANSPMNSTNSDTPANILPVN